MISSRSLPTYQRATPAFDDLFGVTTARVLRSMDHAGDDLVNRAPRLPIDLAEVGFRQSRVAVEIRDPFGANQTTMAICTVKLGTMVPRERRGVHMSRMANALARSVQRSYPDLATYASELARSLDACEYGGPSIAEVRGVIPYIEELRPETDADSKLSLEHLHLLAAARTQDGVVQPPDVGLQFSHLVACPCVQQTYRHAVASLSPPPAGVANEDDAPRLTHSQRCVTRVMASGGSGRVPVAAVLAEIDRGLTHCMNTLPRGAELALVYRAHRRPQFIEDALREALWAFHRGLGEPLTITHLKGRSRSTESIHAVDLCAKATLTAAEIRRGQRLFDEETFHASRP